MLNTLGEVECPSLLGLDLAVLLDVDVVVGLQHADLVIGELDAEPQCQCQ